MSGGPSELFEAAEQSVLYSQKTVAAAVPVALHELVKAAWEINDRLAEIREILERSDD